MDESKINAIEDSDKIKSLPKSKSRHIFYIKTSEYLFYKQSNTQDVLSLRAKALNEKINDIDFARILYSFNKHRGITYDDIREVKSSKNSKSLSDDQEKLKQGIEKYHKEYDSSKYESVGLFLYKNYKDKFRNTDIKKGKNKTVNYIFSIPRSDLKDEIELIFEKQKSFNNAKATNEFKEEYIEHFIWEKDSPSYENLVSPCFYNPNQKSASKHHFYSYLYISLEKLHNLRMDDNVKLDIKQIKTILENSFSSEKGVSYKKIKSILKMKEGNFKGVIDEKQIVVNFESFMQIKKIFNLDIDLYKDIKNDKSFINNDLVDIINVLAHLPNNQKYAELQKLNLENEDISKLLDKVSIKGHLSYSLDVLKKLCNYMLDGLIPYEAKQKIEEEYGKKHIEKLPYLPPIANIADFPMKNNHSVVRALSQVRAIINDVLKFYRQSTNNDKWTFDGVVIELAREMNTKKQQANINKEINKNTKENTEAREFCEECSINNPSYKDILKAKLYKIQNGIDPYVMAKNSENDNLDTLSKIDPKNLFDDNYYEIDHILPYSRSLDDSQSNKVLVSKKTNQEKKEKTPYEWLDIEGFKKLENHLRGEAYKSYGFARVRKILNKDFTGVDGFKQRDIVDTQIISKYTGAYINDYLQFWDNPSFQKKRRVFANNGKITSILRKTWAIGKKNRNSHLHHGEDAILIACSTPSIIQNISSFISKQTELSDGELSLDKFNHILKNNQTLKNLILKAFEKENINIDDVDFTDKQTQNDFVSKVFKIIAMSNYPYKGFKDDFKEIIENAPVTHFVKHKHNSSIHEDTIKTMKYNQAVKIRNGTAKSGGFIRYDVFKIENAKGKITYNFVNLTALNQNTKLEDLPKPTIKENEKSSFIFSVFKNDLLSYELKDGSFIKGNFRKMAKASIVINEPKNKENKLFSKEVKKIKATFLKTDDVVEIKNIIDDVKIKKDLNLKEVTKLETQKEKLKTLCKSISKRIKEEHNLNSIFVMQKMNSIQTVKLREELIKEKIVLREVIADVKRIKTIYVYLSESDYVPSFRADGQQKLINLKKIKTNCLGEEIEITQEKRKVI